MAVSHRFAVALSASSSGIAFPTPSGDHHDLQEASIMGKANDDLMCGRRVFGRLRVRNALAMPTTLPTCAYARSHAALPEPTDDAHCLHRARQQPRKSSFLENGCFDGPRVGPSSTGETVHVPDCSKVPFYGTNRSVPRNGSFFEASHLRHTLAGNDGERCDQRTSAKLRLLRENGFISARKQV